MKSTLLPGLCYWSEYQPDRRLDFNGFAWVGPGAPEGGLLIDPLPLSPAALAWLREQGGARWILLTNFDHLRAAPELARLLSAQVVAPAQERGRFGAAGAAVDHWFGARDELPAPLRRSIDVRWLRGGKSEVEAAFVLEPLRTLLCGDLVRSHESGRLRLLPPPKLSAPALAAADVRALGCDYDALLLGDGDCLFRGARAALEQLAAELA
jgi:glyoxylase-like metal-dependent hydrolase (beta-lactamase superfamily II)